MKPPAVVAASLGALLVVPCGARAEPNVDVAARGGYQAVPSFREPFGAFVGFAAAYRASSMFRVGAYGEFVSARSASEASRTYGERYTATRFGARGEVHLRPKAVLDPWIGFSAGVFTASERYVSKEQRLVGGSGADFGLDVGLDVRVGEHFAVGAVFCLVVPLANASAAAGVWYSGTDHVPLPFLRVMVSF